MADTQKILFVCMGNICRSPAAEIVFRKMVVDAGQQDHFIIDSAGTISYHTGNPPDPRMSETLIRIGYKPCGRARQIQSEDLDRFDLILVMDEDNLADVRALDPSEHHLHKIRAFVDYLHKLEAPRIPDPYYGGQKGFSQVVELLEDGCQNLLKQLQDP